MRGSSGSHGVHPHAQATDGFRHEALFYANEAEFLAGTVPFVREAAEEGAPVLAALGLAQTTWLRGELGADAEHVSFEDMESIGRNPGTIISVWRAFVDDHAESNTRLRGIGEPAWPGRTEAELDECERHEALLNLAFGSGRGWDLLCPYDSSALDSTTLSTACRTHPVIADEQGQRHSRAYDSAMPTQVFHGSLPDPEGEVSELSFGRAELRDVRSLLGRQADAAGMDARRSGDIILAASELAANSIRYGGGGGTVRVWQQSGELLCEVRDDGRMHDVMAGRIRPRADDIGGRGLWLVNHLCDLVQIRSSSSGSVIRLHTALPDQA